MKKHLGNVLKFTASLALGIGLVYWSLRGITAEQQGMIIDSFRKANYGWLSGLIIFGFLSNFFRAQRWRLLLKPIGHYPKYWNTFAAVMIMFFANLAFPRLGEVLRCSILARYEKVPVEKSLGTMVLERVVDLACILVIGAFLLVLEYDRYYSFFQELFGGNKSETAASGSPLKYALMGAAVVIGLIVLWVLNRKHGLEKIIATVKEKFMGLWQGLVSIKDLDRKWEFVFHTLGIWTCYILMPYFGFKALEETALLGMVPATAAVFFGGFAMVATQGGIGAYQIAMQKLLMAYGISSVMGLSFGWIAWTVQTVSVIIGGILSLIFLSVYNKNVSAVR